MDLTQLETLAAEPWALAVAGALVVLVVVALLVLVRQVRRRRSLRRRYGAEYDHTARRAGSARRADRQLLSREQDRRRYEVRDLGAGERERVRARWEALQASFVDDPPTACRAAEELILEVTEAKGYPVMADDPLAGVSVDHPRTLDRYRVAQRELADHGGAEADTEQLRRTLLAARDLFETLVGTGDVAGPGGTRSAFRALVEDDEDPEADAVLHDETPPVRRYRATHEGDETASRMPLYGPDGRPLWEDHADHGR